MPKSHPKGNFLFFIYFLEGSVCVYSGELELFVIYCKMTVPRLDLSVAAGNLLEKVRAVELAAVCSLALLVLRSLAASPGVGLRTAVSNRFGGKALC